MNESGLAPIIEAIIFVAEQPVTASFVCEVMNQAHGVYQEGQEATPENKEVEVSEAEPITAEEVEHILISLIEKYTDDAYGFELRKVAGGYQFFTKRVHFSYVKMAGLKHNQKRLSRSAMETLSIIAYRQPITKAEMEFIRGVNCDYAVQKLLEKKLVSILGRAEAPGRPLLYGTSPFFMKYFGINELTDLPQLKEFGELEEAHLEKFRQHQSEAQAEAEPFTETQTHGETVPEKDQTLLGAGEGASQGNPGEAETAEA